MAVAERLGSEASANDEENHNDASTARATDQSQVFFIFFLNMFGTSKLSEHVSNNKHGSKNRVFITRVTS
jgi:hypothetical protein